MMILEKKKQKKKRKKKAAKVNRTTFFKAIDDSLSIYNIVCQILVNLY